MPYFKMELRNDTVSIQGIVIPKSEVYTVLRNKRSVLIRGPRKTIHIEIMGDFALQTAEGIYDDLTNIVKQKPNGTWIRFIRTGQVLMVSRYF